jgi:hypothetical protein
MGERNRAKCVPRNLGPRGGFKKANAPEKSTSRITLIISAVMMQMRIANNFCMTEKNGAAKNAKGHKRAP